MNTYTTFGRKTTPAIGRVTFVHDKYGNKIGVVYYYTVSLAHKTLFHNLLKTFDLSSKDENLIRTAIRTGEYSETSVKRFTELRKMYIEDNL